MEAKHAFRSLVKSQGWERLAKYATEQIATRNNVLDNMVVNDSESMAEHNYTRGERDGVRLFLNMPEILLEMIEEDLKNADEENPDQTDE